jgi:hypothetical protein
MDRKIRQAHEEKESRRAAHERALRVAAFRDVLFQPLLQTDPAIRKAFLSCGNIKNVVHCIDAKGVFRYLKDFTFDQAERILMHDPYRKVFLAVPSTDGRVILMSREQEEAQRIETIALADVSELIQIMRNDDLERVTLIEEDGACSFTQDLLARYIAFFYDEYGALLDTGRIIKNYLNPALVHNLIVIRSALIHKASLGNGKTGAFVTIDRRAGVLRIQYQESQVSFHSTMTEGIRLERDVSLPIADVIVPRESTRPENFDDVVSLMTDFKNDSIRSCALKTKLDRAVRMLQFLTTENVIRNPDLLTVIRTWQIIRHRWKEDPDADCYGASAKYWVERMRTRFTTELYRLTLLEDENLINVFIQRLIDEAKDPYPRSISDLPAIFNKWSEKDVGDLVRIAEISIPENPESSIAAQVDRAVIENQLRLASLPPVLSRAIAGSAVAVTEKPGEDKRGIPSGKGMSQGKTAPRQRGAFSYRSFQDDPILELNAPQVGDEWLVDELQIRIITVTSGTDFTMRVYKSEEED